MELQGESKEIYSINGVRRLSCNMKSTVDGNRYYGCSVEHVDENGKAVSDEFGDDDSIYPEGGIFFNEIGEHRDEFIDNGGFKNIDISDEVSHSTNFDHNKTIVEFEEEAECKVIVNTNKVVSKERFELVCE